MTCTVMQICTSGATLYSPAEFGQFAEHLGDQQIFLNHRLGECCQPLADDAGDQIMLARCNCFHNARC